MKKVFLTAIAAMAFAFTMTACGGSDETKAPEQNNQPAAQQENADKQCDKHVCDGSCCQCSEECKAAKCENCDKCGTPECCGENAGKCCKKVEGPACEKQCEKACEHKCDKAEGKECCKKAEGKECEHKCQK